MKRFKQLPWGSWGLKKTWDCGTHVLRAMEVDEGQKGQGPFVVALVLVLNYPRAPRTQSARSPATFREPFLGQNGSERFAWDLRFWIEWIGLPVKAFASKSSALHFREHRRPSPWSSWQGKMSRSFPPGFYEFLPAPWSWHSVRLRSPCALRWCLRRDRQGAHWPGRLREVAGTWQATRTGKIGKILVWTCHVHQRRWANTFCILNGVINIKSMFLHVLLYPVRGWHAFWNIIPCPCVWPLVSVHQCLPITQDWFRAGPIRHFVAHITWDYASEWQGWNWRGESWAEALAVRDAKGWCSERSMLELDSFPSHYGIQYSGTQLHSGMHDLLLTVAIAELYPCREW